MQMPKLVYDPSRESENWKIEFEWDPEKQQLTAFGDCWEEGTRWVDWTTYKGGRPFAELLADFGPCEEGGFPIRNWLGFIVSMVEAVVDDCGQTKIVPHVTLFTLGGSMNLKCGGSWPVKVVY